jgi:hypothetical protein
MHREGDGGHDQADPEHSRNLPDRQEGTTARYRPKPLRDPGHQFRRGTGDRIQRLMDFASEHVFLVHAWTSAIGKSARSSRMPR